jgi:predicted enzyme related to lactoylglutathione lyase
MFYKGDKAVAAAMPLTEMETSQGVPPHWNTYIAVDDVATAATAATEAGGHVIVEPMEVMDAGKMAFVADPGGAVFGLWEAGNHIGAQLVNEHGALSWNELITDDTDGAEEFYGKVLGWTTETAEMPAGPYTSWMVGQAPVGGMMKKRTEMGPIPNVWGVYFGADDCDACLEDVKAAGGTVVMDPIEVPEVGRLAVVSDPQGAMFTVFTAANPTS